MFKFNEPCEVTIKDSYQRCKDTSTPFDEEHSLNEPICLKHPRGEEIDSIPLPRLSCHSPPQRLAKLVKKGSLIGFPKLFQMAASYNLQPPTSINARDRKDSQSCQAFLQHTGAKSEPPNARKADATHSL